jgi:hypothetical protein
VIEHETEPGSIGALCAAAESAATEVKDTATNILTELWDVADALDVPRGAWDPRFPISDEDRTKMRAALPATLQALAGIERDLAAEVAVMLTALERLREAVK